MEPEGSLPHSQASATRPYRGLAHSNPHTHNPPPGDHSAQCFPQKHSPPRRSEWGSSLPIGPYVSEDNDNN